MNASLLAQKRLFWLAQALRFLSASYAAWVLIRVVSWWMDSDRVIKNMGVYLERDLSNVPTSSRIMAMALDLGVWLLLLVAVVCCWKSLGHLIREHTLSHKMAQLLSWAGWLGIACQVLTIVARPVQTYWITAHPAESEHVFKWGFYPQDLLTVMLCSVILSFSYLIIWAEDIAEENRGFI